MGDDHPAGESANLRLGHQDRYGWLIVVNAHNEDPKPFVWTASVD
jgi:hypothetical protein